VVLAALLLAGCDTPADGVAAPLARVGQDVDDLAITRAVRSALGADPDFRLAGVAVATSGGEVELSGFLDSNAKIDRSLAVVFQVAGVKRVENHLRVGSEAMAIGSVAAGALRRATSQESRF
jgi:hyperosmotically inducible protein